MTLPPSPYKGLVPEDDPRWAGMPSHHRLTRTRGDVSCSDKDTLMTVIPDRGLHNLLIAHAYKRTTDFIRHHGLSYNDTDQQRLLAFITAPYDPVRESAVTRAIGDSPTRNDSGTATAVRGASSDPAHEPAVVPQSDKGAKGRVGKVRKGAGD